MEICVEDFLAIGRDSVVPRGTGGRASDFLAVLVTEVDCRRRSDVGSSGLRWIRWRPSNASGTLLPSLTQKFDPDKVSFPSSNLAKSLESSESKSQSETSTTVKRRLGALKLTTLEDSLDTRSFSRSNSAESSVSESETSTTVGRLKSGRVERGGIGGGGPKPRFWL